MGPAAARNRGAAYAKGDLLVFIDSDVCVHADTLSLIHARFGSDPGLDALIGSYDNEPDSPGLVSQYKNLLQHFVHQHARRNASTFWTGCGAIRRQLFLRAGGFDERYARPCIEDIALGYRLRRAGHRIGLDPSIQVKHLKRWTLASWLRTDIFHRALPWTRLILRSSSLPDDLNVSVSERFAAVSVLALVLLAAVLLATGPQVLCWVPLLAAVTINVKFYRFIAIQKGWRLAAGVVPLHLAYYIYSALTFVAGALLHVSIWRWQQEPEAPVAIRQIETPGQSWAPSSPAGRRVKAGAGRSS